MPLFNPSSGVVINAVTTVAAPTGVAATDTSNIQAACDAAFAAGGGIVQLRAGTYRVQGDGTASHGCIRVQDYVTLAGAGTGVTTLKLVDTSAADVTGMVRTPSGVQNTHVTFKDFTIDGNKANNTANVTGFFCGVTPNSTLTDTDITLSNVEVMNCTNYGFDPHERTTRLRMLHCVAHDNGSDGNHDGFTLDGQYDGELIGCISYNNGRHGFNLVTASSNLQLIGCEAYSNTSNGFTLQNGAKNNTLVGIKAHDNGGSGLVINGVPQVGQQDNTPGVYNTVVGGSIALSGAHGIQLVGAAYNTISGTLIRDSSQAANNTSDQIRIDESGTNYSIHNTIENVRLTTTSGLAAAPKYGVSETSANEDYNQLIGVRSGGAVTAQFRLQGIASSALSAHNGINEHPSENPGVHGLLEWNYDPISSGSGTGQVATTGTIYAMSLIARNANTITNIVVNVGTAGATLTAGQNLAAIYDGTTGTRLAITSDQAAVWNSTGTKTMALTGTISVTPGQKLIVALMSNGTTPASFVRGGATGVSVPNAGLSTTSPLRFCSAGTSQTALPASITLSSTTATGAQSYWVALS